MRKVFMILAVALPLLFAGCSNDDSEEATNPMVGTTWVWENWMYSLVNGGTWYQTLQFTSATEYTSFYRNTEGVVQDKNENCRYEYEEDAVTLYRSNGEKWNTFIFDSPTKMHPETNDDVIFQKQ